MKRGRIALLFAFYCLAVLPSLHATHKEDDAPKPFVIVGFTPLDGQFPDAKCRIEIELESSVGTKYKNEVAFDGPQQGLAGVVCDWFEQIIKAGGWSVQRNGDRLTIVSFTDERQETSRISRISMTTQNIPARNMPSIVAPSNVKVERTKK